MNNKMERLSHVDPEDRVLLLPHCLRKSNTCQAKYDSGGLQCVACNPDCAVNRLRATAVGLGYKGVCIAPGGRLAVNFIKEKRPEAIVAIACKKELSEGIQGVKKLVSTKAAPLIVIVPLTKDGCVDTEVDEEKAHEIIACGCVRQSVAGASY
jgi:hypothetical protein